MKKNKRILYASLVLGIIIMGAAYYGYTEYNRKSTNLADAKADYTVSVNDIISQFSKDEPGSNAKYLSKVIEVSGLIKKVDEDENGFYTLVLGDTASMSSVRCSLDSMINKKVSSFTTGQTISIKGVCTGYSADDMGLGSDVILNRCVPVKS